MNEIKSSELDKELPFYTLCFQETLRISPPVPFSSTIYMTKDVNAAGLKIRKGDLPMVGIDGLCNDPEQWITPHKFIPERFDSGSSFYLTPSCRKRNPFSFSPFLGGIRICLGKTFMEEVSKVTLPTVLKQFDF